MSDAPENALPQTTEAVAAEAMSPSSTNMEEDSAVRQPPRDLERNGFWIDARVQKAAGIRPYARKPDDPLYRPLRIYTRDPTAPRLSGAVATVNVPYEELQPGPAGSLFSVDCCDGETGAEYRAAHLNDPAVLITQGYTPSPSDPRFHQQMVYAVASVTYATFRRALGRHLSWVSTAEGEVARLRLRPHACRERNAFYDPERGEICFGYFEADSKVTGRNTPKQTIFTCLSHDIIAHEVTHALLDGLRAHFSKPTGPDVLAFHEGFADLVAFFQHFSYEKLLETAIRESRGRISQATSILGIAEQFGNATGAGQALRSAMGEFKEERGLQPDDPVLEAQALGQVSVRAVMEAFPAVFKKSREPQQYDAALESHRLGSVLVGAVFDAFTTIFKRRIAPLIRLATNGAGVLPDVEIGADLAAALADQASKLASQFLNICIRAVDYCPPVDLELGEYLRAVITADFDLVPDDPLAYREAWVDSFRRRGIYPRGVSSLSEDALIWKKPEREIGTIRELSFAELKFSGDPGVPASPGELVKQAEALGKVVTKPENLKLFGLAAPGDPDLGGDTLELPRIQSIRTSRRIGPDGQIVFDLIAEVTQKRLVAVRDGLPSFTFMGGATIIIGPEGEVRYVIVKSILNQVRCDEQREFIRGAGRGYWATSGGETRPMKNLFKLMHAPAADTNHDQNLLS